MGVLIAASAALKQSQQRLPVASGKGTWPGLKPTHTGISTWVKVDTTNLWTAGGGSLSGAQTLLIDGVSASTIYGAGYPGEPTAASPIVVLLVVRGTHTFALGPYSYKMDVYWRGYPWKVLSGSGQGTSNGEANGVFFPALNAASAVTTNVPGSGNSYGDGAPYQNSPYLNNGYSLLPDAGPATSAVSIVSPGDEGFVFSGGITADTRSEINITDNYAPTGNPLAGFTVAGTPNLTPAGIDVFGNARQDTVFYRYDYTIPTSYTAPVTVQNTTPKGTVCTLSAPLTTGGAITSLPVTGVVFSLAVAAVTITLDDGAGHTQTWTTGGALGLSGTSLAVASQTPSFAFPTGTSVVMTWNAYRLNQNQNYKWPDGVTINPSTGTTAASALVTNTASAIGTYLSNLMENQGPATFVWASGTGGGTNGTVRFGLQPISLGVSLTSLWLDSLNVALDTQYLTIVEFQAGLYATGNGVPWIVPANTITAPRTTVWSATSAVAPYGVPLKGDNATPNPPYGGGYIRTWRKTGSSGTPSLDWTCTSAGNAYAVAGTPTLDSNGNISGGDAGKIFGPTTKCNGASLATGPDGTSGNVLLAATAPPFNITVSSIVAATNFRGQGGTVLVGSEMMTFSTYTSSTKTLKITGRAQYGTTAVTHAAGEQIAGMIDNIVLSVGVNQGQALQTPFAARVWPPMIGPTFASVWNAGAALV